jgi:hypothetical protein
MEAQVSRCVFRAILLSALVAQLVLAATSPTTRILAQTASPAATLIDAPTLRLTGDVDSNSPAMWDLVDGQRLLHVLTSTAGRPSIASGLRLARLGEARAVQIAPHPGHGVWMEGVVADDAGTWYGYYHNEVPATVCNRPDRAVPRIGAARSMDRGRTWDDLGIILEAPPGWHSCATSNQYFVGGVGDFSVMLDESATDLYVFFSQYSLPADAQGVAVARLLWADRDRPQGRVSVWVSGIWRSAETILVDQDDEDSETQWVYPVGTPLVRVTEPWHDRRSVNDAYWGPSVHWNTYLRQYVMLLNRAKDEAFGQDGIYIAFAPALHDPAAWSPPKRLLAGGSWYPQIMGLEPAAGTDKTGGARARLFMSGTSDYIIEFRRAD